MLQSTGTIKAITALLLALFGIVSVLLLAFVPEFIVRNCPVQEVQATVVKKETAPNYYYRPYGLKESRLPDCYITFQLPDGTEKVLSVMNSTYDAVQQGDTGTLTFQETKNSKSYNNRHFIMFQKNNK